MRPMMKFLGKYYKASPLVGCILGVGREEYLTSILAIPSITRLYVKFDYDDDYDYSNIDVAKNRAARRLTKYKDKVVLVDCVQEIPEAVDFVYIDTTSDKSLSDATKLVKLGGIVGGGNYFPIGHPKNNKFCDSVRSYFNGEVIMALDWKDYDWWTIL